LGNRSGIPLWIPPNEIQIVKIKLPPVIWVIQKKKKNLLSQLRGTGTASPPEREPSGYGGTPWVRRGIPLKREVDL
jgi:hypothetical protein